MAFMVLMSSVFPQKPIKQIMHHQTNETIDLGPETQNPYLSGFSELFSYTQQSVHDANKGKQGPCNCRVLGTTLVVDSIAGWGRKVAC